MIAFLTIRTATLCATVGLAVGLPASAAAQFGGTVDLHSGPVSWDQADRSDRLLSGEIAAGYQLRPVLGLRPELLGVLGLSTGPGERAAIGWDLGARLHTTGDRGGLWVGGAVGAAGSGRPASAPTRLEGGVRRTVGPAHINVWLSRTGFGGRIVSGGGLNQDSTASPDTLAKKGISEYTDLGSRLTLSLSRFELGLSLTRRIGSGFTRRSGWELSGTWWMASNLGLIGATGHALSQFGLSLPGGRFGTVGLRLALGARPPTAPIPAKSKEATTATPTLAVEGRRLTVRWGPARSAEVMADFTDWKARPLFSVGQGRWTLPDTLSPGIHHLNVRFDGGPWQVPSGALAVDDGFGGRVGLVVVH
jgi:hypothetical protein